MMLDQFTRFASPRIQRVLEKLRLDEECYNSELRTSEREKLVFPVRMSTPDGTTALDAFSRDASSNGLGLIAPQPFSPGARMNFELQLGDSKPRVQMECAWCGKFGDAFWSSGWKLTEGQIDVGSIAASEEVTGYDFRERERERFAIPVVVHQKGQRPRIFGFTRNLSGEGVNLIVDKPVAAASFCMLEFIRIDGERCDIVAECVWAKEYGDRHWTTGWKFPRLGRVEKFHASYFDIG